MPIDSEESSGNGVADLALPNPEQELIKAQLTIQIYRLLKERDTTQAKLAELLGTTQAQISNLMRCRPAAVSIGRLMEFLTTLGQNVEVKDSPAIAHRNGHMSVSVQPS